MQKRGKKGENRADAALVCRPAWPFDSSQMDRNIDNNQRHAATGAKTSLQAAMTADT
ncbi:hypothetical protein [Yoonia sp.]|uniref:hypothetical protein n=1 Tax=Yoonia sp. TaxID=2212373 RepID=UPI0035C829CC